MRLEEFRCLRFEIDILVHPVVMIRVKRIPLTRGLHAIVNDDDFLFLSSFKWHANYSRGSFYAMARIGGKDVMMHRLIMEAQSHQMVDHRNGDPLDNRRENLRFCSMSQNQANSKVRLDSSTGFKGVNFRKDSGKFRVRLQFKNNRLNIGAFDSLGAAKLAYAEAAKKYFGEFARI